MKAGHQLHFNYAEANAFLNKRWSSVVSEMNDTRVPKELRPKEHTRTTTVGGWGQSKLHLQPSINFLRELSDALQSQTKAQGGGKKAQQK